MKNKRKTDIHHRLKANTRNRIYKAISGLSKSAFTKDSLRIDTETYKRWIKYQFTPEMNWSNIEIDHVKPIGLFDAPKHEELRDAFN